MGIACLWFGLCYDPFWGLNQSPAAVKLTGENINNINTIFEAVSLIAAHLPPPSSQDHLMKLMCGWHIKYTQRVDLAEPNRTLAAI